jgi:hypothetical protein
MSTEQREQLVHTLESAQQDFQSLLDEMETEKLTEIGVVEGWSVKDVLAHIAAWEERVAVWAAALRQGTHPERPFWSANLTEDQENQAIFEKYQGLTLQEALERLQSVHQSVMQAIAEMSDEDLFERKVEWLGDVPFAEAIPGNTFEHFRHHERDIRAWLAAQQV